jgi:hypothetical protein
VLQRSSLVALALLISQGLGSGPGGACCVSCASCRGWVVGGRVHRQRTGCDVGHLQVGADDVDDVLALRRVVLREPFQGVEPGQAHRRLLAAELVGGRRVQLRSAPLAGVDDHVQGADLGAALPAEGQEQGERTPGRDRSGKPHPNGIEADRGGGIGCRDTQQPPHQRGAHDGHHHHGDQQQPARERLRLKLTRLPATAEPHLEQIGTNSWRIT